MFLLSRSDTGVHRPRARRLDRALLAATCVLLGCPAGDAASGDCPAGTSPMRAERSLGWTETWCQTDAGVIEGPYEMTGAEGELLTEGSFAGSLADGVWRTYHPSSAEGAGGVQAENVYWRGQPHGKWSVWDTAGTLTSEHFWSSGAACGEWRDLTDGELVVSATFAECPDTPPEDGGPVVLPSDLAPLTDDYGWIGVIGEACPGEVLSTSEGGSESHTCLDAAGRRHGPFGRWYPPGEPGATSDGDGKWIDGAFTDDRHSGEWRTWFPDGRLASRGSYLDGERTGEWRAWHPDRTPASVEQWAAGLRDGPAIEWFGRGIVWRQGQYVAGARHGVWTTSWPSGTPREVATYEAGVLSGAYQSFHFEGHPDEAGTYVDGLRHGLWTTTWPDGRPATEGNYAAGTRVGPWKVWNPDGDPESLLTYVEGVAAGEAQLWHRAFGRLVRMAVTIVDGLLDGPATGVYDPSGAKAAAYTYVGGRREGAYRIWYESGVQAVDGQFANDWQAGHWRTWYEDGTPWEDAHYTKGHLDGPYADWYPSGQPRSAGSYDLGQKVGTWQHWTEDGQLTTQTFGP